MQARGTELTDWLKWSRWVSEGRRGRIKTVTLMFSAAEGRVNGKLQEQSVMARLREGIEYVQYQGGYILYAIHTATVIYNSWYFKPLRYSETQLSRENCLDRENQWFGGPLHMSPRKKKTRNSQTDWGNCFPDSTVHYPQRCQNIFTPIVGHQFTPYPEALKILKIGIGLYDVYYPLAI